MATNQPTRWSFTHHSLLALLALLLFLGAALSFGGYLNGANAHVLLSLGAACLAAEGVV